MVSTDPSLLSRFEKQKMSVNDMLNDRQQLLVKSLDEWTRQMLTLIGVNQATSLKDLFIGFDEDESLQSLVIDITKNNPNAENNEILEKCKECLIATASFDRIVEADNLQDEVNQWKHIYYNQQHHDSICNYFANQELSENSNGHLVIINTFSDINTNVKTCLQGLEGIRCQINKLSTFKTEAQFSAQVS